MAYLHCHSCDWSQDDFWSKNYNPLTKLWSDIKWLWKPRMTGMDDYTITDLIKYTHVPVIRRQNKVFSWNWLLLEIVKDAKGFFRQKWWTWESWKKHRDSAVCPQCRQKNFDID